jgi:hypothetical protein
MLFDCAALVAPVTNFPCARAQNLRKLVKLIPGPRAIPSTWSRNVNHLASSPASSSPRLPPGLQRNRAGASVIADGRNAPKAAIRGATIEPLESTLNRSSWHRQRVVGSTSEQPYTSSRQFGEKSLRLLQIGGAEPLGEP